jgi:DNA polymerase-3 subunit alpha (Gram-positive type)
VNPGRRLEERITELTGITDEQLICAPDIHTLLPAVLDFLGEDILLGHSVLFDYSFLKKAAVNDRRSFERKGIDTLKIARRYLPGLESRSLNFLCRHYEIPHQAHRALEDAEATVLLYDRLWSDFSKEEDAGKIFTPMPLLYQVKRETPMTPAQRERLYKLICKHKLIVEYDLDHLTRNEASRYTDLILAKYGR